ncbi:MAG: MoaD/ThiS family protein [Candidatus Promineifilaceae bacterium]|jgi:sulfur carrier protein ThiS
MTPINVIVQGKGMIKKTLGHDPVKCELADGATVADLITQLDLTRSEVAVINVDGVYCHANHVLSDGAQIIFISPMGGG